MKTIVFEKVNIQNTNLMKNKREKESTNTQNKNWEREIIIETKK